MRSEFGPGRGGRRGGGRHGHLLLLDEDALAGALSDGFADRVLVLGAHAHEVCAGVLEQGDYSRQIQLVSALETVAAVLAEWRGAVFVKGSRRYQLERALAGAVPMEAAHA